MNILFSSETPHDDKDWENAEIETSTEPPSDENEELYYL